MICPHCRANNPEDSLRCSRCGVAFSVIDEFETLVDRDPAAPLPAAESRRPETAAGVLTPPPSSSRPSSSAWPSYGGQAHALEPGAEFGPRYRIESRVGEGGMGSVYRAYDKELERVVALKLLRPDLTSDASALKRFKQELLLASRISHKNVLRIHDLGDAGGVKFISMAFVEGTDLHELLKKEGRLTVERTVQIARQLCGALEAAHAEGVVHRDLKPSNVLIDSAHTIYVSDFGLAKSLEVGAMGMTRTGEYIGTPRYMSPEQVEGGPVDQRTDLYALGLILYEMATGDVPFVGTSTLQVMYQRVKEKPKNPKQLNPDLPDFLVRIILKCLETSPEQRYQNASEVLQDLDAERPPTRAGAMQLTLPLLGRRGWMIAGATLLAVLTVVLAVPSVRNFVFRRGPTSAIKPGGIPPLSQGRYVAVLPFRVLGDADAFSYVSEGVEEALSAKLFHVKNLRVASGAETRAASSKDSLEKIARALGANLIVHGTVQGAGDKIRIIVNLDDATSGQRVWTQEFPGVTQDLLTLEDEIYGRLISALDLQLSSEELARSGAHPTGNVEAYDLYLRGRSAMRNKQDVKNIEAAIRFYEQALQKDAGFALAYAGLADSNLAMYFEKKDAIWTQKALNAALQAQRLNDSLAEIHSSLGSVYNTTGKSAQAIVELTRALELSPNSDEGHRRLAMAYMAADRKDEAIAAYRKAIEVNPYFWLNYNALGGALLQMGMNEPALEAFRKVTELEPDNPVGYENIGLVYLRQGQLEASLAPFHQALERQQHPNTYSNLGTAYFFLKRYTEAVQMYEKAVEMNPNEEILTGNLADAYRWSGQVDKAQATYSKAISLASRQLQVNPRDAATMGSLALYYSKKGDTVQATDFIRRARSIDRNNVGLTYIEAFVHTQAGRVGPALKSLREAFKQGYPPEEAQNDPELGSLHKLPEFQKLVAEFTKQ